MALFTRDHRLDENCRCPCFLSCSLWVQLYLQWWRNIHRLQRIDRGTFINCIIQPIWRQLWGLVTHSDHCQIQRWWVDIFFSLSTKSEKQVQQLLNFQPSTISPLTITLNIQTLTINHQLSTINYLPSIHSRQSSIPPPPQPSMVNPPTLKPSTQKSFRTYKT